jgi:two-component system invasion response regulator UvrY
MSKKITVLIADDHKLIRDTWAFLINSDKRFSVIGETGNAEEAVAMAVSLRPDIILMDISIQPIDGFEATRRILEKMPGAKIIGVSMYSQPAMARKLIRCGGKGYVTKQSPKEEMLKAIEEVMNGKQYICEDIKNLFTEQMFTGFHQPSVNDLSQRELEIVGFIRKGLSSKEIAQRLGITSKTVEVHRYNILRKLEVKNTAELINLAIQAGL